MVMSVVAASAVSTAKAFCPGHITGFLAKASDLGSYDNHKENGNRKSSYLNMGSLGAGLAIDRGVTTTVKVYERGDNHTRTTYDVSINGSNQNSNMDVTKSVVEDYIKFLRGKSYYIKIEHETSIPIGYGLSSSGAAALSLSYALNNALNVGLDIKEAAQIAHCSEIECKTGLGSVLAQYAGGFELRTRIGAPGVGVIDKIASAQNLKVVILCLSPVSTKKFLTERVGLLNGFGEKMFERLKASRNISEFLDISFDFANSIGLIQGTSRTLIERLKSLDFGSSIALFGNTIFSIVKSSAVSDVINYLEGYGGRLLICDVDHYGARLVDI
jgi:pantoate kinase